MTSGIAVFDASPISSFYQVGQLGLLQDLFPHAAAPVVVAMEVSPSLGEMPHWIDVRDVLAFSAVSRSLDAGELAAIALAIEISADFVILDDLAGRLAAIDLGLMTIGSLGLLVRAKWHGLISEVRPTMDAMIASGLYASEHLYRQILVLAGEVDQNRH